MIQRLSRHNKLIATLFFAVCFNGMVLPTRSMTLSKGNFLAGYPTYKVSRSYNSGLGNAMLAPPKKKNDSRKNINSLNRDILNLNKSNKKFIGGPSQPEMSAFKSAGTDNLVNLFTGDFSYNIPLLDVGGYPVNIFFDGGVGMEQEASWVGLGWNINPGNVNRNMRGIPDDFNGEDLLIQKQNVKPNTTWGVTLGADFELVGIKNPFSGSVGASLGISFNNYLGPALDVAIRGNTGLSILGKSMAEKGALSLGGSLSINAGSRTGVTFSPGISLTANCFKSAQGLSTGFGLKAGTSYNSRTGIKAMQISEQMNFNYTGVEKSSGETRTSSSSPNLIASNISFTKPSYVPSMRMPVTNSAYSGHFQVGSGLFGLYPSLEVEVYKQKSEIAQADQIQTKPLVGYLYLQKANNNTNAVMDFTRVNDNEVTPSTPVISAPQYSYDVFTIQGEGTGGSIRAYRNEEGYVRDNYTLSKDRNMSLGGDIGPIGHFGGNFNVIKTPSTIGEWKAGNKLKTVIGFKDVSNGFENVYFRNPGEASVVNASQYDRIGGADLVRYKLGGTNASPTLEPLLERFSKKGESLGTVNLSLIAPLAERKKRTQVISFLTAEEASIVGLDRTIKSYDGVNVLVNQRLNFQSIPRFDSLTRKKHHISQINVTETNGQRYVYGIPVYNIIQKDFTFTVNNPESANEPGKVDFAQGEEITLNTGSKDGYIQTTTTPAFAHSFLLSGLLSPDYVDVSGDGITEDDLGNAVKFNYNKIAGVSKWRTPLVNGTQANFIPGKRSETKDDKGVVSYGERESWYLHSIESKTLIALFKLENRHDSKGSTGELSGVNSSDNTSQRLQQIDLYNKADLKLNGLQGARPIKTVHFEYSYALCKNVPNNTTAGEGKLTLDKIYFTYNGQNRANKNQYIFSYGTTAADNPDYAFNASDRWGSYKNSSSNPPSMPNADYPYSIQDKNKKALIDQNAAAWMLKKILLPSGGQMEMTYESDDYAFVQNKRATDMMQVVGFGSSSASYTNQLYAVDGNGITDYNYAFIQIPEACALADVYKKYLEGIQQLSFRLAVITPNGGEEYINSCATFDQANCGLYTPDVSNKTIWIKLNPVDGISPLSLTAIEYLREQLPGQAYTGYDVSDNTTMAQVGEMFKGWWAGIKSAFTDPVVYLRSDSKTKFVNLSKCFVRLNDHDGYKYGGGYRVKSIRLKDNWREMNSLQLYTSTYGQDYDYTTTETFNGSIRTISSGVASYEPSLGGDENPFQTMVQVSNKVPLGPASYGAIEMPVLDAFFPAPCVGYSKVTVKSIVLQKPLYKSRSEIGKQVTEFYTAKDYPVFYSNTSFDPTSDKQANSSSFNLFFYKYTFDSRALSQGFLVETNDMHGKIKSKASYPENDDKTPVNYAQYFYKNTGNNGLNEKFDFVYASQGGVVSQGTMGIDIELMTDTREFYVKSRSYEVQGQTDLFPFLGGWYPFIWPVVGAGENVYRAVTTTKVITYHSILDSVIVIDKGSQVGTKNLVYDAETGDVIVNRTNNEFKQPVYTTNYPAWWAYSGMGLAYKNMDVLYSGVNFRDGRITSSNVPISTFESGDELYLMNQGSPSTDACAAVFNNSSATMLWAFDIAKNNSSLTNPSPSFVFMDDKGKLYSKNNIQFRIIRSGKRNVLDAKAGSVVTMKSPVVQIDVNTAKLKIDLNSNTVTASAAEFKEKWQTDNDVIKKFSIVYSTTDCSTTEVTDCVNGYLEKNINPYCKGLLGNFRAYQSKVFYDVRGDASENNVVPPILTNLPANGFLPNFKLYWNFNALNNLVPDVANTAQWVWNSQVTKVNARGLELETKDALGIYTAAQYGFGKTIPVAIGNNARLNEIASEGFEDNSYDETLNGAVSNPCLKKQIEFANMAGSSIVNIDNLGLNAHSGRYALSVNPNSNPKKIFPVITTVADQFQMDLVDNTQKDLFQLGGLLTPDDTHMLNDPLNAPILTTSDLGMTLNFGSHNVIGEAFGTSVSKYFLSYKTIQYTKITTPKTCTFNLSTNQSDAALGYPAIYLFSKSTIILTIKKLDNTQVASFAVHSDLSPQTVSIFLNCDTYIIECYCSLDIQRAYNGTTNFHAFGGSCSYGSNLNTTSYRTLGTQNNCTYTKPIPATDLMLNSIFSIPANKKMLFSAWVKQPASATGNKSAIVFSDGSSKDFLPTGPVIEGWQKIEGDFISPATATSATLSFVNNSNATIYYDDIRLHPYNANMKSYVYDPVSLRLLAELDANNYGIFYEYNEEGSLIRTKVETKEGIKTIKETRAATQKNITTFQ